MFINNFWQKKVHIVVFPWQIFLPIENSKQLFYDVESDNSITKYVDANISFNNKLYIPENLEPLQNDYVIDSKGLQKLRKEANEAFQALAKDFYIEFWKKMLVVSAYRSYEYQVGIKKRWCADNFCAKPGYSEHQTGLALDLWETTNEKAFLSKQNLKSYFEWLNQKAHLYGFQNTYQKWKRVDTYEKEPWHRRYVWKDFASLLKIKNIDFAEYYYDIE